MKNCNTYSIYQEETDATYTIALDRILFYVVQLNTILIDIEGKEKPLHFYFADSDTAKSHGKMIKNLMDER